MTPLGRYVLETLVTLVVVAGLAVAILYMARRTGLGRPTGPLQLTGRLALDARRAVYLVRVGETVYVIGASEAGLTKLGEIPQSVLGETPLTAPDAPTTLFSDVLAKVGARRGEAKPSHPKPPGDAGASGA